VQAMSSMESQQRISASQYQAQSGPSYIRITPGQPRASIQQNIVQTPPGVYLGQGMNMGAIRQPIPMGQSIPQQGNRMIVSGQMQQGRQVVSGSFAQNPQNLRY
jgi:hypothetical protein